MDCSNIPARLIRNVGLLTVLALLTACDIGSRELRIYVPSYQQLDPESIHSTKQYENNRAEQSHEATRVRERGMRKFKSMGQAQRFVTA